MNQAMLSQLSQVRHETGSSVISSHQEQNEFSVHYRGTPFALFYFLLKTTVEVKQCEGVLTQRRIEIFRRRLDANPSPGDSLKSFSLDRFIQSKVISSSSSNQ